MRLFLDKGEESSGERNKLNRPPSRDSSLSKDCYGFLGFYVELLQNDSDSMIVQ